MDIKLHGKYIELFWAKVNKSESCWLWQAATDKDGYGVYGIYGTGMSKAHRLSYIEKHGSIPESALLCHTCDTPACVNPDHLFPGTCADNHSDRDAKSRQAKGTTNGWQRLTAEQIIKIRASTLPDRKLATMFQTSHSHIRRIRKREVWKHIP
jgi:hypothetical protein